MQKSQYAGRGNSTTGDTLVGPSAQVWADCPVMEIHHDPTQGYGFFDDFVDVQLPGTQTAQIGWGGKYKVFATASGYVKADETISVEVGGGILAFNCDTDNDSASLAVEGEAFRLSGVKATGGKLWFECRIAMSSIATGGIGFLVGLAETQLWTLATGVPWSGAEGAITNTAGFIGFHYPETDTSTMDTVYSDRATSFTKVKDAAVTGVAADTFVKLGMVYDPDDSINCIRFYQDGVPLPDVISRTTLTGLTNLDAGTLGLIFSQHADSAGTAIISYLDWWRCYQLRSC
ncbi:hypothetical protein LCGC14_1704760 [marine sediment metagenome]|uniref:Legume lectin domain-containing protein n=1 Tax=marine sediment metagenome TaxID=412755 RepID=A0A0F9I4I7_9ZZZZ